MKKSGLADGGVHFQMLLHLFTRACKLLDKLLSEKLVFKHALQTGKGFFGSYLPRNKLVV